METWVQQNLWEKARKIGHVAVLVVVGAFTTACGKGDKRNPVISGVKGPYFTAQQDGLLISMELENVSLQGGVRYAIPKHQNSWVALEPSLKSNGTLLSFFASYDDLLEGELKYQDPQRLPGDRAIPGVASGSLPAVAFTIPELGNSVVYIGSNVYGVFVPVNLGLEGTMATFRLYSDKKRVGNISIVGEKEKGDKLDGLFLALDLTTSTAKKVMKMAKR